MGVAQQHAGEGAGKAGAFFKDVPGNIIILLLNGFGVSFPAPSAPR